MKCTLATLILLATQLSLANPIFQCHEVGVFHDVRLVDQAFRESNGRNIDAIKERHSSYPGGGFDRECDFYAARLTESFALNKIQYGDRISFSCDSSTQNVMIIKDGRTLVASPARGPNVQMREARCNFLANKLNMNVPDTFARRSPAVSEIERLRTDHGILMRRIRELKIENAQLKSQIETSSCAAANVNNSAEIQEIRRELAKLNERVGSSEQ